MRVGIIGAGQLGQMLGIAARALGIDCCFLDPSTTPPAAAFGKCIQRPFDDPEALRELAAHCDVITYEFENVPVEALRRISDSVAIHPPTEALCQAQDRLHEKRLFQALGIPLADYRAVDTRDDLTAAVDALGLPTVVKTRRLGYDGKGQFVIRERSDSEACWARLGGRPLIAEQWVPFDFEVSSIGVRGTSGETAIYPLTRNVHRDGILHTSCSPLDAPELAGDAANYVLKMLQELDYVGVLALELFVFGDRLMANEFAPRVHNSGHWSIEGAATSQFTNHLLAVTGQPLGSTESRGHAGMLNLIGEIPDAARQLERGTLHDYGKTPRPGRKLGHITVVADSAAERDAELDRICRTVTQSTLDPGFRP
jgi:5-(carboxyamino)imidazole ribonucleotide synthase